MPVVAVHGDCDLVVPLAAARDAARRTGGELVVVHGATHSWLLQDPETLPAIVRELLDGDLGAARDRAVAAAGLDLGAPLAAVDDAFAPAGTLLRRLARRGRSPGRAAAAAALLRLDADPVPVPRGAAMTVTLTWIGQAGFLVRTPATRLAVDPFLSDHPDRRFPSPVGVDDLAGTELVLATHQHLDHLDSPALAALLERDDRVRVVLPAPALADAAAEGLPPDRLVGARRASR